jgi:hypothetical protein
MRYYLWTRNSFAFTHVSTSAIPSLFWRHLVQSVKLVMEQRDLGFAIYHALQPNIIHDSSLLPSFQSVHCQQNIAFTPVSRDSTAPSTCLPEVQFHN